MHSKDKPDDVITDVDQDAAAKGPKQKPEAKAKAKNTGNKKQNVPTGAASSQLHGMERQAKVTYRQVPAAALPEVVIAVTAVSQEAPVLDYDSSALRENVPIMFRFADYRLRENFRIMFRFADSRGKF